MDMREILYEVNGLSLPDLYTIQNEVAARIDKEKRRLINSVSTMRNEHGTTLKHPTHGTYICKNAAYKGRWRMWKMIPGQRGLKQGPVVVEEAMGDLDSLKIQVALGHYKDF